MKCTYHMIFETVKPASVLGGAGLTQTLNKIIATLSIE